MREENNNGVSLFSQSDALLGQDPIEEIFALNLGDFITENLISEDLAKKIGSNVKNKKESLKNQLKELISIYSLKNTLCVLSFDSNEESAIYTSIAKTISQMLDVENCEVYLSYEFSKTHSDKDLILVGASSRQETKGFTLDENLTPVKAFNEQETIIDANYTAIPMCSNVFTTGVIVIQNDINKPIKKKYLDLVESITSLFATSMALQKEIDETNKLIEDESASIGDLQHIRAELTALIGDLCDYQQAFVENLANAVDVKNQYTVSHSKNTARLAKLICKELELNEKTTDLIYYAALLQNIGKIALPEKMFATNGKLTQEELKLIQNQTNSGVHLLMNINFLSEVVPYITYKSERFNGSGTPEGLKGNSIPLGSRIIAVADAYSAMTSDRPYRKAMESNQALDIIQQESGKNWDPIVIEALSKVI